MFNQTLNSAEVLGVLTGSAFIATNQQGLVTAFSPETEMLLGLKSSDVLNRDLSVLPPALKQFLSDCLNGDAGSKDFSFELQLSGRKRVPLRVDLGIPFRPRGPGCKVLQFLFEVLNARIGAPVIANRPKPSLDPAMLGPPPLEDLSRGTAGLQTPRWREMDSNLRSR